MKTLFKNILSLGSSPLQQTLVKRLKNSQYFVANLAMIAQNFTGYDGKMSCEDTKKGNCLENMLKFDLINVADRRRELKMPRCYSVIVRLR